MGQNQIQDVSSQAKIKKPYWKNIFIVVSVLLVISIAASFIYINQNNKVINSWRGLYEEAIEINLENEKVIRGYDQKIKENDSVISQLEQDKDKLKQDLRKYYGDLTKEQRINSALLCDKRMYDFSDVNFVYSGNTAMNRELKKFIENNLELNEKITGSTWDPIWNNVDVATHKISITGNIRFYFVASYEDKDFPELKNSIYWIDRGCFLDFLDQ